MSEIMIVNEGDRIKKILQKYNTIVVVGRMQD